nr:MAG TPA: Protein of unknown function (DUF1492) [Caudoviricetes sp.]
MNKKELKRLRYTQEFINTKKAEIELLKKDLMYIRGLDYTKEHTQGGNVKTQEDLICEIMSQEQELTKKYKELYKNKQRAREKIMLLDDKRYQIILYQYYLLNKSFDEIAGSMHYTTRHVQRLHGKALEAMKNI